MLILRLGLGHTGDPLGAGWEYGGVFLLTAGLMNLLLVLDAWDLALGREPSLATTEAEEDDEEPGDVDEPGDSEEAASGDAPKEAT